MRYQDERLYTGSLRQLFGVRESRLIGGKADGVHVVDIHNDGELELCVAAGRYMDLAEVRFRGRVLNYITPNGIVHPSYYSCYGEGWSWIRSFRRRTRWRYYTPKPDAAGWEHVRLENRRERLGMTLSFDTATLGHFVQWKNFVKGEYVMGLEPANCTIDGRSDALARGQMQYLEPGQSRTYRLRFCFDDTEGI